jgi:mRNA interferase MazF
VVTRGEIWLVALDPTLGSQIRKTHPCVVVSPPELHDYLRTAIVAPMTTAGKPAPYRIGLTFHRRRGLILLDQIRTVDQRRLVKRLGKVGSKTVNDALSVLRELFAT